MRIIGDRNGGKPHTIDVPDGAYVSGLNMRFVKGIMCRVEVCFSDGTTSGMLGNRGDWCGVDVVAEPTGYKLVCGDFRVGGGPSNTLGTGVIMLQFDFPTLASVPASSSTLDDYVKGEEELHDLLV